MNKRVTLLVEDNSTDEELTLLALHRAGITSPIVVVRDGAEALDVLFSRGAHAGRSEPLPHVVLLDLNLPKVSGLEVLRAVRADERTRLLPVVILTSSREDKDLQRGYSLGANSYIVKPVGFGEFSETVGNLGRYWIALNQRPPEP
jgi:two-component system response regulator